MATPETTKPAFHQSTVAARLLQLISKRHFHPQGIGESPASLASGPCRR